MVRFLNIKSPDKVKTVKGKQLKLSGQVMRREKLENLIEMRMVEGRRGRRRPRPREKYVDGLAN